jgi:putative hydrolase of the HAD superfamily
VAEIKNIIFDLGGVIINLAYERTRNAFIELGMKDFDSVYSKAQQSGFFDAFDKGELSPAEFRNKIRSHIAHEVSDAQIDAAWDAMLLDIPQEKLQLLSALKKKYRTFLLSNTNEIHITSFSAYLQRTYGTPDFTPYFDQWYYSCRIGMRKPDAEIFEFVLRENDLRAAETLFIDDSEQHIRSAKQLGIHTLFFDQNASLEDALRGF